MSDDNVRHEERPIMKKAIALLVAAMLLTGLSACGGSTTADAPAKSDGTSKTETNKEEPKPQPADLTGTVYGQINVYSVTTKSERYERSYWTRTAAGNGIGGRKAPVPYGS